MERLSARFNLPVDCSTHADRWYIAPHLFGDDRETPIICQTVAARINANRGHLTTAIWLLQIRRIFKNPITFMLVLAYSEESKLWKAVPTALKDYAQPMMEYLVARAPDGVASRP